jgi:hypothetical protein
MERGPTGLWPGGLNQRKAFPHKLLWCLRYASR